MEVEPLTRCEQAQLRQQVGVALRPVLDDRLAPAAFPRRGVDERLELDPVATLDLQAAHQVDRAAQQPGQQPGALREGGGMAEKIHHHAAPFVQRHAIAGDREPLAAIQPLRQFEHQCGIHLADLQQPQLMIARLVLQTVEVRDLVGVHQHIQRHLFPELGQCAADIEVAQVRADQDFAATALAAFQQARAHAAGIVYLHFVQRQLATPHVEAIEQAVAERHELPEHAAPPRAQIGAAAPRGQVVLILAHMPTRAPPGYEKVQHDQVQHRRHRSAPEPAQGQCGELHQPEAAALLLRRPMLRVRLDISHGHAPPARKRVV